MIKVLTEFTLHLSLDSKASLKTIEPDQSLEIRIYVFESQHDREGGQQKGQSFTGSCPKFPTTVRPELRLGPHTDCSKPCAWGIICCFPRHICSELDRNRAAGTLSSI